MLDLEIRALVTADAEAFRAFRLAALEADPESFATAAEDWRAAPAAKVEALLAGSDEAAGRFILGAFDASGALAGVVGLGRESKGATRHKGSLWGLHVDGRDRRCGLGERLVREAIRRARATDGLEQIRLTATASDAAALRLFERCGFRTFGVEPRARRVGTVYRDQVYMILFLAGPP